MNFFTRLFHAIYPLSQESLQHFIAESGTNVFYGALFLIVFCETGLVVTPFLPGDSLLFAVGAVGSSPNAPFSVPLAGALLILAALLGDNVNYWLGRRLGPAVFSRTDPAADADAARGLPANRPLLSRLLNRKHLDRTQAFYETYGPKMVILARFVPIVRTFAPFVAGIGKMNYARFLLFSVIGAVAWVSICMTAGYLLGGIEFVKRRFEVVILAIIIISVLPMAIEILRARMKAKRAGSQQPAESLPAKK